MKIDAVIFDLGGTLIEYTGGYTSWPDLETPGFLAAYDVFLKAEVPVPPFERFRMVGFDLLPRRWRMATSGQQNLTVESLLADVLASFHISLQDEALLATASSNYQLAVCADAKPIQNSYEVVSQLKADGYKLGLVSNTMFTGDIHRADLARFDLEVFFDAMIFSADANKWKPNPAPFLHILENLEADPARAVFIGDDPAADVIGANRAGMYSIHLRSSQRFPSPDGVKPDITIIDLAELPAAIKIIESS